MGVSRSTLILVSGDGLVPGFDARHVEVDQVRDPIPASPPGGSEGGSRLPSAAHRQVKVAEVDRGVAVTGLEL